MRHDEFIGRVQERAALPSRDAAEGLTRATLEALGERLSPETVRLIASQLPAPLGDHLVRSAALREQGVGGAGPATEMIDAGAFLERVTERSRASEPPTARDAGTVMAVLDEAVPPELVREIQSALPPDLVAALAGNDAAGTVLEAVPRELAASDPGRLFGDRSSRLGPRGRAEPIPDDGRTGLAERGDAAENPTLLDSLRGVATLGGVAVALAMWLALGFALIGLGMADPPGLWLGRPIAETSGAWWSIAAMAVALLVGGMAGGLGISSARSDAALVQGVLVWALFVIAACLMAWMDIGVDVGPVGRVIRELRVMSSGSIFESPVFADIRGSSGYAVVAVTVALITSCVGALIGWLLVTAKDEVVTVRV